MPLDAKFATALEPWPPRPTTMQSYISDSGKLTSVVLTAGMIDMRVQEY